MTNDISISDTGSEMVSPLILEEGETISAVSGYSFDMDGDTKSLQVTTTSGMVWTQGYHMADTDLSLRTSPATEGIILTHLSGDETGGTRILCFNWASPRID